MSTLIVCRGDAPDQVEDLEHLRALADDRAVLALDLVLEPGVLLDQAGGFQGPVDEQGELVEVEGLADVVARTQLDRLDGGAGVGVGGDHEHGQVGPLLADAPEQVDPALGADAQVDQGQVDLALGEDLQCPADVGCGPGPVLLLGKRDVQNLAQALVVVDDEDLCHRVAPPRCVDV
jgi:hypothetical protein